MNPSTDILRSPLVLPNGNILPNRIAKAAMTEGLADLRGAPDAALETLYAAWGQSGCGLLITGNIQIARDHLERAGNVVIEGPPDAALRAALRRWAEAAKAGGARIWMQISHAGRQTQALVNPHPHAPSAIALALPGKQFGVPRALSAAQIGVLVERYAQAAQAAQEAGFDGVQIHAAHGYLLSSFLNPRANVRGDAWGGSLENRARMLLDVVRATRARTSADFAIAVKLNSADFQQGGFSHEDSARVVRWLEAEGVDLIEISGGSYEQPRMMDIDGLEKPDAVALRPGTRAREAYFAEFAAQLTGTARVPLMVTGGFRSLAAMHSAVHDDGIALIGLGRPLCVDLACVKALLDGRIDHLDAWEKQLRLGPGWFGPQSPVGLFKMLNGFGVTYWYYQQFRRIARGLPADPTLGVFTAFRRELATQRRYLAQRETASLPLPA